MTDPASVRPPHADAARPFLNDAQVRRLKLLIAIMTALLAVGLVTLIGRIIYLVNQPDSSQRAAAGSGPAWVGEATASLPIGHEVRSTSLSGRHLAIMHSGPSGDGVVVVDLSTGVVVSRVRIDRGR